MTVRVRSAASFGWHVGDERPLVCSPDHGIELPVTQAAAPCDHPRALLERDAPGDQASLIADAVALASLLLATQVAKGAYRLGTCRSAGTGKADTEASLLGEPQAHLLGVPVLGKQAPDPRSERRLKADFAAHCVSAKRCA